MLGYSRAYDLPAIVRQNDHDVEQLKRSGRHNEHIDRGDAADTTAAHLKTLAFSARSEFSLSTPIWAVEGRLLYSRAASATCGFAEVHSQSPSDSAMTLAHREFARYLPKYKEAQLTPVSLSPNNVAMVLWVKVGDARILLGSDLEESNNPGLGWRAIVNSNVRDTMPAHRSPSILASPFLAPAVGKSAR